MSSNTASMTRSASRCRRRRASAARQRHALRRPCRREPALLRRRSRSCADASRRPWSSASAFDLEQRDGNAGATGSSSRCRRPSCRRRRPPRARSCAPACRPARRESRAAARSAKNAWRSARDSGVCMSSTNSCALVAQPFVERLATPRPPPRRRTCSGAGKCFGRRGDRVARELEEGLRRSDSRLRCRARACADASRRRPCARTRARRRATSPSTTSSNSAVPRASPPARVAPDTIMLSAVSTPTARGRRCVPPAPGSRPSLTSGSASVRRGVRDAEVAAERELEAAAHADAVDRRDRPACRFPPATRISVRSVGSALAFGVLNSRMSAPPENALPAPMMTIGIACRRRRWRGRCPATIAAAHGVAQPVDRRIVERDDGDAAVQLIAGVDDRSPAIALDFQPFLAHARRCRAIAARCLRTRSGPGPSRRGGARSRARS